MKNRKEPDLRGTCASVAIVLLAMAVFLPLAHTQTAADRKEFVKRLASSTLAKKGNALVPAYNLSVDGPDSTAFVYHAAVMNPSICRSLLSESSVAKFHKLGFTKLICTDDDGSTFSFDPEIQKVSTAMMRRDFAEMVRKSVVKQMGDVLPLGFNITAEGPEATDYVHHQTAANSTDCNSMLTESFFATLRTQGFLRVICTDDSHTNIAVNLTSQPFVSAANVSGAGH